MNKIVVFGISHRTSPIEERERISFGNEIEGRVFDALLSKSSISECVIVSTCNRVEIYATCDDSAKCFDEISSFLREFNGQVGADFIEKKFYFLEGEKAIRHLYRVAAGMDSMVVGEPQILGQLRRAYEAACKNRSVGTTLNKLFQSAFSAIKKIKNETGVGLHMVSVSSVAVKLVRNIFGDIEKCPVIVVGTGEAAAEAATQLAKRGAGNIRIAGRNEREAAKLASSLGGSAMGLGEVSSRLKKTDIIISATGSSNYILKREDVRDAMKLRKNKPISLIDIAFPRDIDPGVRDIEGIFLYDMDDLQNIIDRNLDGLRASLDEAEEIIKIRCEQFLLWQKGLKAFPVIVELRKQIEEMVGEELRKTIAKIDLLERNGVYDKAKRDEALRSLSHRIMEKFLHKPVTKLKREAASSSSERDIYVDMVRNLFELDPLENENKNREQK